MPPSKRPVVAPRTHGRRSGSHALPTALLVAGWIASAGPAAIADEPADTKAAHESYERGARAFGQGSYAVAATEFARADELGPTPAALEMALKAAILADDPVLGMSLVDRAAARPPNASVGAQVARAKDRFADKVGRLEITCAAPCSAKVGTEPATLGAARYYRAGNYVIEITAGGAPELFAVQLPAGADMKWSPPLKAPPIASAAPTASAIATAPTASAIATAPAITAAPPIVPLAPPSNRLSPAWFGVGLGVTAVAGGLALGFGLDTLSKHDAFLLGRTQAGASAGLDAQLRTNVAIGVTAATAIATAVLGYFVFRTPPASPASLPAPRTGALSGAGSPTLPPRAVFVLPTTSASGAAAW